MELVLDEASDHIRNVNKLNYLTTFDKLNTIDSKKLEMLKKSKVWLDNMEREWTKKITEMDKHISDVCKELKIPKIADISFKNYGGNDIIIRVDYVTLSSEQHEGIVKALFDRYNHKKEDINIKLKKASGKEADQLIEEKRDAIAELYQLLELLHPYKDGQGRTDLVLQAKLLSEEGLNPAILGQPYMSTWSPLSDWKDYLKQGVQSWKDQYQAMKK